MGRASPLLIARLAALVALAGLLVAYYLGGRHLWNASVWWDIAWLDLVLLPAVFGLVYLALPLWRAHPAGLLLAACAVGALTAGLDHEGFHVAANFGKLAAVTLAAWWFLGFFETLGWVVIVACIIPFVDGYSVWRGPTRHIVENQHQLFSTLSFLFPSPGGGGANLGLPDLLFFALFLAASARFALRVRSTWLALVVSLGATMALTVVFDVGGLPALPLLSVGFLAVNADLIRRRLRRARSG